MDYCLAESSGEQAGEKFKPEVINVIKNFLVSTDYEVQAAAVALFSTVIAIVDSVDPYEALVFSALNIENII